MKLSLLPAAFLTLAASLNPGLALADNKGLPSIAVANLKPEEGVSSSQASLMSDILRTELFETGKFTVMNREDMDAILKEIKFQQSGACDQTSCIVEMGQALGVQRIVTGSIGVLGENLLIHVKLVNVASSENEILVSEYHPRKDEGNIQPVFERIAGKIAGLAPARRKPSSPFKRYRILVYGAYESGTFLSEMGPSGPLEVDGTLAGAGAGLKIQYSLTRNFAVDFAFQALRLDGKFKDSPGVTGDKVKAGMVDGYLSGLWLPLKGKVRPFIGLGLRYSGVHLDDDFTLIRNHGTSGRGIITGGFNFDLGERFALTLQSGHDLGYGVDGRGNLGFGLLGLGIRL